MKIAPVARDPSPPDAELGLLRAEVRRLSAELARSRAQAAALETLAHEDPLTGALNRRGFLRDLGRAIAYTARYGTPAALIVADLDRFKPINDRFGHEAGDRALLHLAALLRRNTRVSDSVGRIGGDEFALILWQLDGGLARQKALSLQAIVAESPLLLPGGPPVALNTSIGVTMLTGADSPDEALARADRAMYLQKADRQGG